MRKSIQFTTNRELITDDFSGYKLDLQPIHVYRHSLNRKVDVAKPSRDQFSLAHLKVFSLHNYIFANPFDNEKLYYIDCERSITQIFLNSIEPEKKVGIVPVAQERDIDVYPISIQFAAKNWAVVVDGYGYLHFYNLDKEIWEHVHKECLSEAASILKSVKMEHGNFHIVVQGLSSDDCSNPILEWITLNEHWHVTRNRKISVSNDADFICLEESCCGLFIISKSAPKFVEDSEIPVTPCQEPKFFWTQTSEVVRLWFAAKVASAEMIHVAISDDSQLQIQLKDEDFLNGELVHSVVSHTWSFRNKKFELILKKSEDQAWPSVIKDDQSGIQVHSFTDEEIRDSLFNREELEECDMGEPYNLIRLDGDLHQISHEADLTTSAFLFPVVLNPEKPPALCLRNLSDGFVWLLDQSDATTIDVQHVGTFNAFGYVLASKNQKKFVTADKALSYVVVANVNRHIYLFRQPSLIEGELKNRTTGRRVHSVARQQIIALETNDEIIGIYATDSNLVVLTEHELFVAEINNIKICFLYFIYLHT